MDSFRGPLQSLMQWLGGAAVLLICDFAGRQISQALTLPVPGSVVGMLLLLLGLMLYGRVPRGLAVVSGQLLRLLALLFLPAAVGVFYLEGLSVNDWLALLAALVIGTLISLVLCALLMQKLLGKGDGDSADD
ncbi:CidA/LrgA family protein [Microbulbifer thermotolerans]|nr:CidA/LrgA family protein [Microbulbifer thermotolerans]